MNHLIDWVSTEQSAWERCLKSTQAFAADRVASRFAGSSGRSTSDHHDHPGSNPHTNSAAGRNLGLLFFNDSLRTRVSMELAMQELGGRTVTVTPGAGTWGFEWEEGTPMLGAAAEHITEAIGVLGRYVDALGVRLFASGTDYTADRKDVRIRKLAKIAEIPILNMESAWAHPCQALADAGVLKDTFGSGLKGRRFVLTWTSHPRALPMAVPNSTLRMAARLGLDVTVARPTGYELDPTVMSEARGLADISGGSVQETDVLADALRGADVVYAKSWGGHRSYSDPEREAVRRAQLSDWKIGKHHLGMMNQGRFMHCLPIRRNVVADDAVLDSRGALHLDQAEYRLYSQKAILSWMLALNQSTRASIGQTVGGYLP